MKLSSLDHVFWLQWITGKEVHILFLLFQKILNFFIRVLVLNYYCVSSLTVIFVKEFSGEVPDWLNTDITSYNDVLDFWGDVSVSSVFTL